MHITANGNNLSTARRKREPCRHKRLRALIHSFGERSSKRDRFGGPSRASSRKPCAPSLGKLELFRPAYSGGERVRSGSWRRERDSNPRYGFPHTHFPGVRLQPLGHPSSEVPQVPRAAHYSEVASERNSLVQASGLKRHHGGQPRGLRPRPAAVPRQRPAGAWTRARAAAKGSERSRSIRQCSVSCSV